MALRSLNSAALLALAMWGASPPAAGQTIVRANFDHEGTWPEARVAVGMPGTTARVTSTAVGTIDVADTAQPSGGLLLSAGPQTGADIRSSLSSGLLPVQTNEHRLGKFTLSFDGSVSKRMLVTVRVESFDRDRRRTGGLATVIAPAAVDFYQRTTLELDQFQPDGDGTFDPAAPLVQFVFAIDGPGELRIDNVAYATPAWYVSPTGDDSRDGRTESTAFQSPQRALNAAQPGDIVVLMEGKYSRAGGLADHPTVATFVRPGSPAGWITLKNYPGHHPVISANGQQAVGIIQKKDEPTLAYLEVRGLRIRGNGDTAREEHPEDLGKFLPSTDSKGIVVNGRVTPYPGQRTPNEIVHHIRVADNVVEYCTADGIYVEYCDWLFVERNVVENNCWTTTGFAPAGLSVMGYANFDLSDNVHKMLIASNRVSGNRLTVMNQPWGKPVKTRYFNGNGILLDANAEKPPAVYAGRTLVQNNLVFNNGGGGIQMWGNHRMDLVNNTVCHNGTTPELKWGQIGFERCRDVRLVNNIIVAQPDRPLDTWKANRADQQTEYIQRQNNLYWGGVAAPIAGVNDLIADPEFVASDAAPWNAVFRPQSGSPARAAGVITGFTPLVDLEGKSRPVHGPLTLGALE